MGDGAGHYQSLNIQGNFTTGNFQITGTGGNTDVTVDVPCYRRGTRILTDHGEVAVEDLQVGDLVQTVTSDTAEPIIWIGYRHVDCAHHTEPEQVWPVRIAARRIQGPGYHMPICSFRRIMRCLSMAC